MAAATSKVTGRSKITTCRSVREKSCIIGLPPTSTSTMRRTRPSVPITEYWTLLPHPKKYDRACSSPVAGSRFGWAV